MMTREDILRELELLPVWRLKTPLANDVASTTTPLGLFKSSAGEGACATTPDTLVAQAPSPANAVKKIDNPNLTQGIHQRGYLPHLKAEGGIYAVTFRLNDSLPAGILEQMADLAANEKNATLEAQLNAGHGECLLARAQIAEMLKQVLLAKHSQDYYLHAWVIMPNHVHLLVEPLNSCVLSDILQAIKSISARQANQLLARDGAFWQRDSYDHLVRDEDDFNHALEYIEQNPVKANLVKQSCEYALGSAFAGGVACATTPDALVAQAPSPANQATNNYLLISSNDKKWAFIMPASPDLSASQSSLFNNILQALKIEKTNKTTLTNLMDIEAKVIIAMGETVAQALLNTQDSLEQLRGKLHLLHNIPLVVTYHPNDCLQHLPNKSKAWDDLCAALSIMNA
jgi:putative transposase